MRSALLYILLLLTITTNAQPRQEFIFSNLGIRNGLITEEVTRVQQDQKGFIWISTLNGLQRFDSKRFVTFRHIEGDSTSIPSDYIYQMAIDNKNRIWLSCEQNRIGYFDPNTFKFHEIIIPIPKAQLKNTASGFQLNNNGEIIVGVLGRNFFTYDEKTDRFVTGRSPFQVPDKWNFRSFFQDKNTNIYWLATDSGLVRYNPANKLMSYRGHNAENDAIIKAYEDLRSVTAPFVDRTGRFWLMAWPYGGSRAIYSIDKGNTVRKNWDSEILAMLKNVYFEVGEIQELRDGSLWIYGLNLFAQLNRSTNKFEQLPSNLPGQYSLRYDAVRQMFEDRERNIWISTNRGVFRINPGAQFFKGIPLRRPDRDTIFTPDVTDVLQTKRGEILISTWGSGLFAYDDKLNAIHVDYVDEIAKSNEIFVWCMVERANGEIWRGHQDGQIYITRPGKVKSELIIPPEANRSTVRQIVEDKSGNIWLGTQGGRLVKMDSKTNSFSVVQEFKSTIQRLMVDKEGNIWVCTQLQGAFVLDPKTGRIINTYNADGPPAQRLITDAATDIFQYNDTTIVIASGGLNTLNTRKQVITHPQPPNELPANAITNIIGDRWGYLWVTSQSGLVSVDMNSGVVTYYNAGDGVHTNSFNVASSGTLKDGRIVIGTPHDWMIFEPDAVVTNGNKPAADVAITRVMQINRWLNMDSLSKLPVLTLKYDENSLTIEMSTLTYQTQYGVFYIMEGLDKDWQLSRVNHLVSYNYLPPGDYTFRAMCKNSEGHPSKNIAVLHIRVKAPFWKTWWFLGLLVFAGICLLYWLDKFRTQRIRATESIRTRIATSLTEDMSNSLSNINISSELAKTKIDTDTHRTREYISQISDTSNRMVQAMYDMVWSINPANDTMADTIDRMKSFASEIESLHGLNVDFDTDERVEKLKIDMEHRYELLAVFKEAIMNAGRHSGGRFVKVSLRYKKSRLLMMIVDDGKGFNMDNATMLARGISDMRRRAAAINASFYIESEINTGTIVKLEMNV